MMSGMARTARAAVRTVRREAFVDVAQRLIQGKGYEQMSVQDVLDELDASKGAFYHYFDSKEALLEAVVERFGDEVMATLAPIVDDPDLSAIQKIEAVFAGIARWKAARKDLVLAILEVWVSDDNAIVREKLRRTSVRGLVPLLAAIIGQGIDDGLFTASSPDAAARIVVSLMHGFNEEATELFIARQANTIPFEVVQRMAAANTEAFERILGIRAGSLTLIDEPTLHLWFG